MPEAWGWGMAATVRKVWAVCEVETRRKGEELMDKISQEWLIANGFDKRHFNPAWNGGFFRYYLALPEPYKAEIMVSFGDGYEHEDGFMVWLAADMTYVAMKYVRTIDDLRTLYKFLCGEEMGAKANVE